MTARNRGVTRASHSELVPERVQKVEPPTSMDLA